MPFPSARAERRAAVIAHVRQFVAERGSPYGALASASRATGVPQPKVRSWVLSDLGAEFMARPGRPRGGRRRTVAEPGTATMGRAEALKQPLAVAKRLERAHEEVAALEAEYDALKRAL